MRRQDSTRIQEKYVNDDIFFSIEYYANDAFK